MQRSGVEYRYFRVKVKQIVVNSFFWFSHTRAHTHKITWTRGIICCFTLRRSCLAKFSHMAWSYFRNAAGYLLKKKKTSPEIKSHLQSLEWILNVIFIDEWGWLNGPWAQRSQSVGGGSEADINHVSSMLLTFGATGRLGVRLLQEHPLQRPLVDGGLYTQVNNSPCPEGSTNNTPSITKGHKRKRVGNKKGKETTNIYLLSLLSLSKLFFFMIYYWLWKAWGKLIGSGEFKKEALVIVWKQLRSWFLERTGAYERIRNETSIVICENPLSQKP